jgi:hypothetical protein
MRTPVVRQVALRSAHVVSARAVLWAALTLSLFSVWLGVVRAATTATQPATSSASAAEVADPFGPVETETDPFETTHSTAPVDAAAYVPRRTRWDATQTEFQSPAAMAPQQTASGTVQPTQSQATAAAKDPCAAAAFKPLTGLGINIAQPAGQMPTDFATPCWDQINAGPSGACRCWPVTCYQWDATCLCYRPLYFEEINAERYGYVCGGCLQPAVSAAHFFATVPALPYCMAADCPGECVYTLGHYRPGSCPPWRCHYPPCDPIAAASAGGIYTGLIFAIP